MVLPEGLADLGIGVFENCGVAGLLSPWDA